jgi:hypothetical protein
MELPEPDNPSFFLLREDEEVLGVKSSPKGCFGVVFIFFFTEL